MKAMKAYMSRKLRQDVEEQLVPFLKTPPQIPRDEEGVNFRVTRKWKKIYQKHLLMDQASTIAIVVWHMDEIEDRILREKEDRKRLADLKEGSMEAIVNQTFTDDDNKTTAQQVVNKIYSKEGPFAKKPLLVPR